MTEDPWQVERLDLDGYLRRIGVAAAPPSAAALDELHEAHLRAFTFDNIDVLLDQHPGVLLPAVQEKFVARGRGGYCFEHATLMGAALQRLGYDVRRHLGRVGDPRSAPLTHCVLVVTLEGRRVLCDPGFGLSIVRPVELRDGTEVAQRGHRFRVSETSRGWQLARWHEGAWETMHTTPENDIVPVDLEMGHHFTSTLPTSHFRAGLRLTKLQADRHVSLSSDAVTIRREGEPTERRRLADGELAQWLHELGVPLTQGEEARLLARLGELTPA